ncbi:hypothetical protein PTSG_08523 [Salpingoeca rosetta]|uniref:Uncharacterized protein n=1 Tax=Salpingoeca rosetta (strain ATCC 50818 / BSB-021) TaxID=946362 RepID=F2UJX7_SALR5|nr:uncharacterized protein PTSG_08523 [Salpingoeca rosetta]EGD77426.1 hypothetical protein PTSG_08523 [Salpingoeca rosetta]|eukprot:XP_004990314.1 hypothetical protein PTSG_08523 [Salpingoeca rosetta]
MQSIKQTSKQASEHASQGTCIHSLRLDERHVHHVADDEDDDGGLNNSIVSLSGCHHQQAADIVITAVRRRSVQYTGMETVSQPVVSSVVAGIAPNVLMQGCTGTSCTTASHPTDSHGHCTFAVIECCQHVAPPQPATSSSPSPTLPSSTTTAAVFRHLIFCQRGITPRPQPSLHAAGFKQLAALDAVGSWTTTPGSKEVATVFLVRMHVLANVAQERFLDYDNDSVPFMKNILHHANDRQYRMLRGLMGVSVCKDMFAPDAHDFMRIMQASAAQIEEDDPQPTYIHTSATENCISVFVKIARNPAHGLSKMLTHLLDWLPITEDDDETKYIFTYLVELLQARDPRVTAPESPVKIVRAFVCAGVGTPAAANMQDSPAHGVLGQLTQDPGGARRVQRAVEALSSSA